MVSTYIDITKLLFMKYQIGKNGGCKKNSLIHGCSYTYLARYNVRSFK